MTDFPTPLPTHAAILIHRIHAAGRYLDNVAANTVDQASADVAREHANAVWDAALQVESLTRVLQEVVPRGPGVA